MKPIYRRISVRSPMSSANLSAGFDVLGVALDAYYDELDIELDINSSSLEVVSNVPLPDDNTARRAAELFYRKLGRIIGTRIILRKGIPAGMGLGSSGASAAGVAFGLNLAFGLPLKPEELIDIAARSEKSPHADNVSASILGGFAIVYSREPYSAFSIYRDWKFILIIPNEEPPADKTAKLRKALGEPVPFELYVQEKFAYNSLLRGLLYNDRVSFAMGMNLESYHQIVRGRLGLYDTYYRLKNRILEAGALGACISGAGPSILVLPGENTDVHEIEKIVADMGISAKVIESRVSKGVEKIKVEM